MSWVENFFHIRGQAIQKLKKINADTLCDSFFGGGR